ncbi:MAG TPA: hypothetical protein VNQ76_14055 [Planctomicrobium sp.]|nr:hypothetical protein [Planctomicrobium sp.]
MGRFLITLTVTVSLLVAQRVYTAILLPMTAVVATSSGPDLHAAETSIHQPALFEQQAMDVFPDAPWTRQAEHTFQLAEAVTLYFRELQRVQGSGNTIQISPVAILWRDPKRPETPPYRILAERAQIKFQNTFFDTAISLTDAKPGRVVWASLEGSVHIDGPDGLKIEGQNFKFEEEARQLYSDDPIEFAFGPTPQDERRVVGMANQIQLTFLPSDDPYLKSDMPRVGGLAEVQLRRNVVLDSTFQQQGEPRHVRMTSAGSLIYDIVHGECTVEDQVQIVHRSIKPEMALQDTIECEWIRLQLETADNSPPNSPASSKAVSSGLASSGSPGETFDRLVLKSIRAKGEQIGKGKRLKMTSDEQQVVAVMQDFFYDARNRQALLTDEEQVQIRRGDAVFRSPVIDFRHTADNGLDTLECRGPGELEVLQEGSQSVPVVARWKGQVQVLPDPTANAHAIRMENQVQVAVPEQFRLDSDLFTLWVDLDRVQSQQAVKGQTVRNQAAGGEGNPLSRPLPLKRMRAEGNVVLHSDLLQIRRSNVIDAVFVPGIIEPIHAPQRSQSETTGLNGQKPARRNSPVIVEADQFDLDLIHDSLAATIDFRRIIGQGKVALQYYPDQSMSVGSRKMEGPFTLTGHRLTAENGGGIRQVLTVQAEPGSNPQERPQAVVGFGAARLWGGEITLFRHENRVHIPGPGGLSAPLPEQKNGPAVAGTSSPQKLDIIWSEKMNFDGLAMQFWGKITASVPGEQNSISRLLCEDLTAVLNQRISFVDPQDLPQDPTIESLLGKHNVTLEAWGFENGELSALRTASVASFELHQSTGEFQGQGPGEIHSWTLGDQVQFAPSEQPRANQPPRSSQSSKWRYAGVAFAGKVTGNWNQNEATLKDRVQVITAPVEKARVKFHRNQLSDKTPDAENAVWMKCHQLRIVRRMNADQKSGMMEVFATGATELEGHVFRATADELTYDERRGQFVLRGLGREATLYHQPEIGQPASTSAARLIQFSPAKREINIGGSTGFSGGY